MAEVVVVGAGLGGLSSAMELAAAGHRVLVLEAADGPGGKAGIAVVDDLEVDTGPSLLTMPDVFREAFRRAGTRLDEHVELRRLDPAFRYRWPDGVHLDVHHDFEETIASVRSALGGRAAKELKAFVDYARQIWAAAEPHFVAGDPPSAWVFMKRPTLLGSVASIDPFRRLGPVIDRRVREPHLRDLLRRYATYNGSDARDAPAALACIVHVEMQIGAFGVQGGIHEMVRALVRVGEGLGVTYRYGVRVEAIERRGKRVSGVRLVGGERVAADAVVANADVAHVGAELMPSARVPEVPEPLSMSAWNGIVRAARPGEPPVPHRVLFPRRYDREFEAIFDDGREPEEPTVYCCAPAVAHGRERWDDAEPLFLMGNAPAERRDRPSDAARWTRYGERVLARARSVGWIGDDDRLLWERSPRGLADRFPGSRGALYGAASSGWRAAFKRPPNRVSAVPGLYLASGSAHPGGGMPLAMLSGRAAARALGGDLRP